MATEHTKAVDKLADVYLAISPIRGWLEKKAKRVVVEYEDGSVFNINSDYLAHLLAVAEEDVGKMQRWDYEDIKKERALKDGDSA